MDHYVIYVLCLSCFVSVHWCLVITCLVRAHLWLSFVIFNCFFFVTFPCGILDKVWYLILSISDVCHLSYLLRRVNIEFFAC